MTKLAAVVLLLSITACAATPSSPAASITLPMPVPPVPAASGAKDEPLPVGATARVPGTVGRIRIADLPHDERGAARVAVDWPGAPAYRLQLRATGDWRDARVRALGADGRPLHIDHWLPARSDRWWSAITEGCCMTLEITGTPGAEATLTIVDATAVGEAR